MKRKRKPTKEKESRTKNKCWRRRQKKFEWQFYFSFSFLYFILTLSMPREWAVKYEDLSFKIVSKFSLKKLLLFLNRRDTEFPLFTCKSCWYLKNRLTVVKQKGIYIYIYIYTYIYACVCVSIYRVLQLFEVIRMNLDKDA